MLKEAKKYVRRYRAFTLVEVILVIGMIALITGVLVGMVQNSYEDFKFGSNRSTLLQDGQAAIEQMIRILRQALAFNVVSQSTDQVGYITFTNVDGVTEEFRLNILNRELEYGQPGSLSALTGSVDSLVFTCYDIDGNVLTGSVPANSIQSVQIEATLSGGNNSFTLSGRVFVPKDFQYLVINEIMYNPPGSSGENAREWVELYNLSNSAIDLSSWEIWTGNPSTTDQLEANPQYGNGSTEIAANGYAVITTNNTTIYNELVTNGGFESYSTYPWQLNNWWISWWYAHFGSRCLASNAYGQSWAYQNISIPSSVDNCTFSFWEITTASVAQTQVTATIRNLSNQVLETGYSGQMHSDWTCHTMDLASYAGQTVRIYIETNKSSWSWWDLLMLDDVSVVNTFVDTIAAKFIVDDSRIGNGLSNNSDTVAITDGSATVDSVSYDDAWGGDGDGTSLSRIDPQGPSNDEDNWTSGPVNGTPGSAN